MALAKRAAAPLLLAGGLILGVAVGSADEAHADPYEVSGIAVDVEAENAVMARELAIEQAQQEGLRELLERLTVPSYYGQLPSPGQQSMSRLVSGFEVEQESLSATRYVGELSVVYDAAAVQDMMQGSGVPIAIDLPPSLLIVPAVDIAGGLAVFTGPDGWRNAWAEEAGRNTLLDIRLPLGDLDDLRTLSGEALNRQPETALADAAARYGTEAAMLVVANPDDPEVPSQVTVAMGRAHGWSTPVDSDTVAPGGAPEVVWAAAVRRFMNGIESQWKADNVVLTGRLARLGVDVELGSLDIWADIRRRLAEVAAIRQVEIETFAQQDATLVLNYIGSLDQLQRSLATRGLDLADGAGSWRLLRMAGQPSSPSFSPGDLPSVLPSDQPPVQPGDGQIEQPIELPADQPAGQAAG
jgi:hypothetical protein